MTGTRASQQRLVNRVRHRKDLRQLRARSRPRKAGLWRTQRSLGPWMLHRPKISRMSRTRGNRERPYLPPQKRRRLRHKTIRKHGATNGSRLAQSLANIRRTTLRHGTGASPRRRMPEPPRPSQGSQTVPGAWTRRRKSRVMLGMSQTSLPPPVPTARCLKSPASSPLCRPCRAGRRPPLSSQGPAQQRPLPLPVSSPSRRHGTGGSPRHLARGRTIPGTGMNPSRRGRRDPAVKTPIPGAGRSRGPMSLTPAPTMPGAGVSLSSPTRPRLPLRMPPSSRQRMLGAG